MATQAPQPSPIYADGDTRHQTCVRMINLLRYLVRRVYTRYELAGLLKVDERTVRRYIYAWQRAGVDIQMFQNSDGFAPTQYRLTVGEWTALVGREPEAELHGIRLETRQAVAKRNAKVRAERRASA